LLGGYFEYDSEFNNEDKCYYFSNAVSLFMLVSFRNLVYILLSSHVVRNATNSFFFTSYIRTGLQMPLLNLSNEQGGEYGNALQAASYGGDEAGVRLLLNEGADVNAEGGEYGNALQAASYGGHEAVGWLVGWYSFYV
jgi:hypothetical protein